MDRGLQDALQISVTRVQTFVLRKWTYSNKKSPVPACIPCVSYHIQVNNTGIRFYLLVIEIDDGMVKVVTIQRRNKTRRPRTKIPQQSATNS